MAGSPGRTIRKTVVIGFLGFLGAGFLALVITIVFAIRLRDAELMRSTGDVNGLIGRVYDYRRAGGRYPRSLAEIRPIAGDAVSKHEKDYLGEDENFCAAWCWTYLFIPYEDGAILRRYVGDHGHLTYMFAPGGYPFRNNLGEKAEEGWFVTSEGSARYLGSFFSEEDRPGRGSLKSPARAHERTSKPLTGQ